MEAQHVLEELGEPVVSYISAHEVIEVESKKVSVRYVGQWIVDHCKVSLVFCVRLSRFA